MTQPAAVQAPATPQAAPKDLPAATVASPTDGAKAGASEAASAAAETPGAPPAETPDQKLARVRAAGKAARRSAAQNRELQARVARQDAENARLREAQRAGEERDKRLRGDKWAAVRELGIDPRELAQQALKEGTPEYQSEQRITAAEREAREAKEQLRQFVEQQQQRENSQAWRSAQSAFLEASKAHPAVAALPEDVRVMWADRIIRQARAEASQRGLEWSKVAPTDSKVLAYMNKQLSGVPGTPAKAPDTASSPDASQPGSATPQTVTNKVVSAKYTLPANYDSLSDQEQKAHFARYLESLQGGKRIKNK